MSPVGTIMSFFSSLLFLSSPLFCRCCFSFFVFSLRLTLVLTTLLITTSLVVKESFPLVCPENCSHDSMNSKHNLSAKQRPLGMKPSSHPVCPPVCATNRE